MMKDEWVRVNEWEWMGESESEWVKKALISVCSISLICFVYMYDGMNAKKEKKAGKNIEFKTFEVL